MRRENEMKVASQVSEVEVADRHSPNLLTMPMVEKVVDSASRMKWAVEEGSFTRQSVDRSLYDLEHVRAMADRNQSPGMASAYEHVASDMVRRMGSTITRAVAEGEASYAMPGDEAVIADPVRAQRDAGLQHVEKVTGLAQPIFSEDSHVAVFKALNHMTNRIAGHLRDADGREIFEAVSQLDFATTGRPHSPGADKVREERTGEEQRTLAAFNAIATEGMIVASTKLMGKADLLTESERNTLRDVVKVAERRMERGAEVDVRSPEHVEHRRGHVQAAMAASAAMQR
jgi:hypothetical protein